MMILDRLQGASGAGRVSLAMGSVSIDEYVRRLGRHMARVERQIDQILEQESRAAVKRIKVRSPVDTGLFRRSWKVHKLARYKIAIVNSAPYAEHVHKAGERGHPFWQKYAEPEIREAQARVVARLRALLTRAEQRPAARTRRLVAGGRLRVR